MIKPELTIYFDGLCPLCSREIAYYRKRTADDPTVHYLDITDPTFDARAQGLDPTAIHRLMHVKVGEEVQTGLNAFIALWERVPGFRWLARLARFPGVYQLFWVGYRLFALVRPYLPRRKPACDTGTCER
jgi:predicted DCC family thiol-disulfide oxidoreductase YuxK